MAMHFYSAVELQQAELTDPHALAKWANLELMINRLNIGEKANETIWLLLSRVLRDVINMTPENVFPRHPGGKEGASLSYIDFKLMCFLQLDRLQEVSNHPYLHHWQQESKSAVRRMREFGELNDECEYLTRLIAKLCRLQKYLIVGSIIVLGPVAGSGSEIGLLITACVLGSAILGLQTTICALKCRLRNKMNQMHQSLGRLAPQGIEGTPELASEAAIAHEEKSRSCCCISFWKKKPQGEEKRVPLDKDDLPLLYDAIHDSREAPQEGKKAERKDTHQCFCADNDKAEELELYKLQGDGGKIMFTPPMHRSCLAGSGFRDPFNNRLVPATIVINARGDIEYKILTTYITLEAALLELEAHEPQLPQRPLGRADASSYSVSANGGIIPTSISGSTDSDGEENKESKRRPDGDGEHQVIVNGTPPGTPRAAMS